MTVSEIASLNNTHFYPAGLPLSPLPQESRFNHLMAQNTSSPENNWTQAVEVLKHSRFIENGSLTEQGRSRVLEKQSQLQNEYGVNISLQMAAQWIWLDELTHMAAAPNASTAVIEQAQALQTQLYSEIQTLAGPSQNNDAAVDISTLESSLKTLLDRLGWTRAQLENSPVGDQSSALQVSDLLADKPEAEQLDILIRVAHLKLLPPATVPQAEPAQPKQPPVVEPVVLDRTFRIKAGELYEIQVDEGQQSKAFELLKQILMTFQNDEYYGSTYHLQFLNADNEVLYLAPNSNAVNHVHDQISVYWHGPQESDGTTYTLGGDIVVELERTPARLGMQLPVIMVDTGEGAMQALRMDQIPFTKIRISNESNQLLNLPTQADVDEAKAALQSPGNLSLQQLLKYTTPALLRADYALSASADIAKHKNNIETIISNGFSETASGAEILAQARRLSDFVIENRRGFGLVTGTDLRGKAAFFIEKIHNERLRRLQANGQQLLTEALADSVNANLNDTALNVHKDFDLRHIDLQNADLSGQILYRLDLRGVNLENANLEGATLIRVRLDNARLDNANLQNTSFEDVSMRGTRLNNARLTDSQLNSVDLRSANMEAAILPNVNLSNTRLSATNLSKADLRGAKFNGLSLLDTNLQEANLHGAKFRNTKLSNVNLRGADLDSASFYLARLLNVNLTDTQLSNTNFDKALVADLIIDQTSIDNSKALKEAITPPFDIEAEFSKTLIDEAYTFEQLHDLENRLRVNYISFRSNLHHYLIDNIKSPQIARRKQELILSGTPTAGVKLMTVDLSHQDLRNTELAGARFLDSKFNFADMQGKYLKGIQIGYASSLNGVDLRQANLTEARLTESTAYGAQLQGANLRGADIKILALDEANMAAADISAAHLEEINLTNTNIDNLIFDENTTWHQVRLTVQQAKTLGLEVNTQLGEDELTPADTASEQVLLINGTGTEVTVSFVENQKLPKATTEIPNLFDTVLSGGPSPTFGAYDFSGLDLSGLDLQKVYYQRSNFQHAILRNVNFEAAKLELGDFNHADLREANLESTDIKNANFQQANLNSASLIMANAPGADFKDAQLVAANLSKADLQGVNLLNANLQSANLNGADMRSANVAGADLRGVDLRQTDLEHIKHDQNTQWQGAQLTAAQIETLGLNTEQLAANTTSQNIYGINSSDTSATFIDPGAPDSLQDHLFSPDGSDGFTLNNSLKPFSNPNGLIGTDGTQANHADGNNNGGAITAVAGDAEQPDHSFKVINGQVVVGDTVLLPELDLSNTQSADSLFNIPAGLAELPTYTPASKSAAEGGIPVADTSSETQPTSLQAGGVTWGGLLGSPAEAEKNRQRMDELFGKGWSQGVRPDLFPTPIDSRIPGFGEGLPQPDLNSYNTGWGLPDAKINIENETFPQKDEQLENILRPNGEAGPTFIFPPATEHDHLPELHKQIQQALPELQKITYAQYNQLSVVDQQQIINRTLEYRQLSPDNKANIRLIDYLDSRKTSDIQRQQLSRLDARQDHYQAGLNSMAQSIGLDTNTIELINTRITALQLNTRQNQQHTQILQQDNAQSLSELANRAKTDPVAVAFIQLQPQEAVKPPYSNTSTAIPRFMVIKTKNGPQLIENRANGQTVAHFLPLAADTPITRQLSDGRWVQVPDVGQIGGKLFLDLLFTQGALKMLNNGGAVNAPGQASNNTQPQPAIDSPQPGY